MSSSKEIDTQERIRTIRLGEEFFPFEGQRCIFHNVYRSLAYSSKIILNDSSGFKTPMEILLLEILWLDPKSGKYTNGMKCPDELTPFNPEEGYVITNEDYNIEKRLEKHSAMWKNLDSNPSYFKEKLFNLWISSGLARIYPMEEKLPEMHLDTLKRLRLQVEANKLAFQTRLDLNDFYARRDGYFFVNGNFYPLDSGRPLAKADFLAEPSRYPTDEKEGVSLLFPDDPEKLATIRMKFVLAKNSNHSTKSSRE